MSDLHLPDDIIFLDRYGNTLRHLSDKKGERHLWVKSEKIPDLVKKAFIAAEDERFYSHLGFDPLAILRAFKDNFLQGKIVSGASTITQQLARIVYPRKRSYHDKFIEIIRSIRLETALTKEEILLHYLNRVPMGNNIIGIGLASLAYFDKSIDRLSPAEAAILASLPRAPGYLNPFGNNRDGLLRRKNSVLKRMNNLGFISDNDHVKAVAFEIDFKKKSFPNDAPHLVEHFMVEKEVPPGEQTTSIDLVIQKTVEKIVTSHEARLSYRGAFQSAAMVLHNPTMEVLATVGSIQYSFRHKGFNNGTLAMRSAGSTLKPLAYALALENGHTVASLLQDTLKKYKTPKGDYSPINYDKKEYGPVTMRTALGNSLNISAIKTLEKLGTENFYDFLKSVNLINNPSKGANHYGLGLVVGNLEVSLEKLIAAYAMLANRGKYNPVSYMKRENEKTPEMSIVSEETAYIISEMLSDPTARNMTFGNSDDMNYPYKVSLKTGTSTKYRDGWIIGYTPEYTVGVWTGNFEGIPTYSLSGAEGAAPILYDIINSLYRNKTPSPLSRPTNIAEAKICGISGMKPNGSCQYVSKELFIHGTEPNQFCTFHSKKEPFHKLPVSYASWVEKKRERGMAGSYRLEGVTKKRKNEVSNNRQDNIAVNKRHSIGAAVNQFDLIDVHSEGGVNIIYPLFNDRFIIEKTGIEQQLNLEVVLTEAEEYIDWIIDGKHFIRVGSPYGTAWTLKRGVHTIAAVTSKNIGDEIKIFVE